MAVNITFFVGCAPYPCQPGFACPPVWHSVLVSVVVVVFAVYVCLPCC